MTRDHNGHIDPERMQAFLDGELSQEEMAAVQEHTAFCARCQSEIEAWEMVFSELDLLGDVSPSEGFSDRVMAALPRAKPKRAWGWGWQWLAPKSYPTPHLSPGHIQDFLDGRMSTRQAARVEAHFSGCEMCAAEVERCQEVLTALEGLPQLAPSDGFSERVMAQWRVETLITAVAPPSVAARVRARMRGLLPATRKGWAAVAGAVSGPPILLIVLSYFVFSRPLVTPTNLGSFLWWKASDLITLLADSLKSVVLESAVLFRAYTILDSAAGSPWVLGMGGLIFSALLVGAAWVLYRYLVTAQPVDSRYAQLSL